MSHNGRPIAVRSYFENVIAARETRMIMVALREAMIYKRKENGLLLAMSKRRLAEAKIPLRAKPRRSP